MDISGAFCIVGKKLPIIGSYFTLKCPPLYKGGIKESTLNFYLVGNTYNV